MKAILAILILTMTALPIDRPYNHWAFYTIKCDDSACYAQPKILYDTQHLDDALEMFRKEHHDLEIRCVTRDYYFSGCVGWY